MRFLIATNQYIAGIIICSLSLIPDATQAEAIGGQQVEHYYDESHSLGDFHPGRKREAELPLLLDIASSDDGKSENFHWPFHQKNSSNADTNTSTSKSCSDTDTCEACNAAHLCHWCSHDGACHAMGSFHGCLVGSSCRKKHPKNESDPTGCLAHESCGECSVSSHLCHWCAHDNACHSIGSVYGCVAGVDCYDNSHCQRKTPEPFARPATFPKMGILPLMVISVISGIMLCCVTTCCCIAGSFKGAYDDLIDLAEAPLLQQEALASQASPAQHSTTQSRTARAFSRRSKARSSSHRQAAGEDVTAAQLKTEENASVDVLVAEVTEEVEQVVDALLDMQHQQLEQDDDGVTSEDYVRMVDGEDSSTPLLSPPPQRTLRRRPRRSVHRLYNACACCYMVAVTFIGLFVLSAFRYFPVKPVYNICNDSVAWKSLIDSMTAMKVTADFELLASVSNPNHFDVALDMGKGSFSHDGAFVGTYEIPPVTVAATSITDILIIASFTPEKWEALAITAEYYRGTLVLHVDAEATIRIPALADYSFSTDLKDLVVHVNEKSDRSLCACPTWSDTNKTTTLLSTVPHWIEAS